MEFPEPFNPYPINTESEGRFFIPWYRKVPFFKHSLDWCLYFSLGVSNMKLNGLWIDFLTIGIL